MRLRFLSTVSFLVLAMTAPAMAGFEFVAPVKPAAPAPVATIASDGAAPLDPVIMAPQTPAASPVADSAPVDIGTMAIPLTPVVRESDALIVDSHAATSPSATAPVESAVFAPTPAADWPPEQDVAGFGRDVPLVMALQQIAPAQYRYSFDHGIDPGMRISWSGGKKWRAIVADIARENSLAVDVVSNVIAFRRRSPMDIVADQMAGNSSTAPDSVMGVPIRTLDQNSDGSAIAADTAADMTVAANAPVVPVSPVSAVPVSPPVMPDPVADAAPLTGVTGVPIILDDAAIAAKKRAEAPITDDDIPAKEIKSRKKILTAGDVPTRYSTNPMEIVLGGNPVPTISDVPNGVAVPNDPVLEGGANPIVDDAPPVKKVDLNAIAEWQGRKNMTLHDVLGIWASNAGISLVWSSQYDYPLQTDVRIKGTLTDAVRTLLAGFSKASPRPIGRLFKNAEVGAQPVLVVETQRLTN